MIASAPILCPRFIGRGKELALVVERYREASGGSGGLVLIGGDAGIGKTRFLSAARHGVEEHGARFALAQCLQYAQSPLGPLGDALAELDASDPEVLKEPGLRAALGRLLPALAERPSAPAAVAEDRRAHYAAIAEGLRRFSARQPVVLAVEDAHWADLTTLEFLQYVASKAATLRMLLLITYRSDELHRQHPFAPVLPKLERAGRTTLINLASLSRSEMQSFMAAALEGRPGVVGSRVRDVIERAEGNPLFAEELLSHVGTDSGDVGDPALPLSVRASVLARTSTLDDSDREVLSYAAALGRRFEANLLAKLSGQQLQRVGTILRRARDLQLLRENRSDGTFEFRHPLMQEALHDDLLSSEQRELHSRIVHELEMSLPSDERTIQLAYHSWAARDAEKASSYNEAAGDIAARRLALADATRFYERALEFAHSEETQAELSAKFARALSAFDPGERARRAFERAIAHYERSGDATRVAELLLDLGRFEWRQGAQLQTRERALEALASFPDHPMRFGALTETACWYTLIADPARAERYLVEAEPLAGSPKLRYLAHYHSVAARVALLNGDVVKMSAEHERAVRAAEETTDFEELGAAHGAAAWGAMVVGNVAEARARFASAIQVSRDRFLFDREAINLALLGKLELFAGDLEGARARLLESAEKSIDLERPYIRIEQAIVASMIGLRTGDNELIERFAREEYCELAFSMEEASIFTMLAAAYAELYVARGDRERAGSVLARAITAIQSIGWYPPLAIEAASYASSQIASRAREMLARWAHSAENRAGKAYVDLFDAAFARREGADAAEPAMRAAERFAGIGFVYYEALALETGGRLKEALAMYRRMGALGDARRLEEKLNPVNRRGRAKSALTARESEVAALIAEGKSNKAIADALTLSERTVEHHVASILAKLEASSRAELAVALTRAKP